MANYDAFISYSHARDKPIAAALQSVIQALGKPWYRRRALRLFRDDTSLSATPHLWPTIEQALSDSRFLIVLASPDAAASQWVGKEVAWWLDHKSIDTLLIAVTDGEIAWDNARGDFIWNDGIPLPQVLVGRFKSEPKWVDVRAYREGADPSDADFIASAANFAAAIHGVPKEDLLSQEVRQQRRMLTLAWSAVGTLAVLMALAGWQWWEAESARKAALAAEQQATEQRKIAQQQRDRAVEAENVAVEQRKDAQTQRDRAVEAEAVAVEQRKVAQTQRDRAEKTLAAATTTANTLVNDLAVEFRERSGMPIDLVRKILDRARGLQRQLTQSGEVTADLRFSETAALMELAMTLLARGDTNAAIETATEAREIAEQQAAANPTDESWQRELSLTYGRLGWVLNEASEPQTALAAFRKALAIREKLADAHPDDGVARRDLAVAHGEFADALRKRDVDQALQAYRTSLAMFEALATASRNDSGPGRDQSLTLTRMGEALEDAGRHEEAAEMYQRAIAIMERLAAADPSDTRHKNDLSRNYVLLGSLLREVGEFKESIDVHRRNVQMSTALASSDPANAQWQRELAVAHEHLGHALRSSDQSEGALVSYRSSLAIREKMTAANSDRRDWRNDLAVSYTNVGDMLWQSGKEADAFATFRKSHEIRERLAADDPDNPEWVQGLATSNERLGDMLRNGGKRAEALQMYRRSLALREKLDAMDPNNTRWRRDLAIPFERIGKELLFLGQRVPAIESYRKALAIREGVQAKGPETTGLSLVFPLYQLGLAGDAARDRFSRALTILQQLDEDRRLNADQQALMRDIRQRLAKLPR